MRPMRCLGVIVVLGVGLVGSRVWAEPLPTSKNSSSTTTTQPSTSRKTATGLKITPVKSTGLSKPPTAAPTPGTPPPTPTADQQTRQSTKPKPVRASASKRKTSTAHPPKHKAPAVNPPKPQATAPSQPRASAATAHPSKPQAAAPTPSSPSSSEGIITIEGSIRAVDLQSSPPSLQLAMPSGKVWTLTLVPARTTAGMGGQPGQLAGVKVGDSARVSCTVKAGTYVVKAIEVTGTPAEEPRPTAESEAPLR